MRERWPSTLDAAHLPRAHRLQGLSRPTGDVVEQEDQKKKWNIQFQHQPEHLYISHLYFVGVGYDLMPTTHPYCAIETFGSDLASDDQVKAVLKHPRFMPTVPGSCTA